MGKKTCAIDGCDGGVSARGWCAKHYVRWKKFGDPLGGGPFKNKWSGATCSIDGCGNPRRRGSGMCNAHYLRFLRHGDATHGRAMNGAQAKFIRELVYTTETECITWPFGGRDPKGWALSAAHNVCTAKHGERPSPKHEAAHSCGNGHLACVNPNHLRWRSHAENMREMAEHGRSLRGGRHPNARLTSDDVREIRAQHKKVRAAHLAERYGVCRETIYQIQARRSWAWL